MGATSLLSVRIGSLQLAGLQCHTDAFEPDPDPAMPGIVDGGRLVFAPGDREALADYLSEASNSADAQAEIERRKVADQRDSEALAQDRKMAAALASLSSAVRRVVA